jgi:hypothetical protein
MADSHKGYICSHCSKPEYEPGDCCCLTNPKDRLGTDKPNIWTIPPASIAYLSKIMELGAKKYGAFNWRSKKVKWTIYYSAAMRHLMAALDGEDADPESGYPHEAHAMACVAILLDAKATGNLVDDRPVKGKAAELMRSMTTTQKPAEPKVPRYDPLCFSCGRVRIPGEDHTKCRGTA